MVFVTMSSVYRHNHSTQYADIGVLQLLNVTMFPMGFGESILLHQGDSCLLVDCGSESKNKNDYFDNVVRELEKYSKRSLLISHFHMDHMNGIKYLYDHCPHGFDMVYLPSIFEKGDTSLEIIIIQHLNNASKASDSYPIWNLLKDLIQSQNKVRLIQRGDHFDGPACHFEALWPIKDTTAITLFTRTIHNSSNFVSALLQDVSEVADNIRQIVQRMISTDDIATNYSKAAEELHGFEDNLEHLQNNFAKVMREAESSVEKKEIDKLFERIKKNEHSIVFHTLDNDHTQILMTGDITSSGMNQIAKNCISKKKLFSPSIPLKTRYEEVKTPHHGIKYQTKKGFLEMAQLQDINRLLISNGETPELRRGSIAEQYLISSSVKHVYCTNTICKRCEYLKKHKQCADSCVNCKAGGVQINCVIP